MYFVNMSVKASNTIYFFQSLLPIMSLFFRVYTLILGMVVYILLQFIFYIFLSEVSP